MQIGSLTLSNKTVLAPLAGITNLPFRLLAKTSGCGLVCSEMISANGLVYQSSKTEQMLNTAPEEKPLSVQIFGSDPGILAEAAAIVESKGADIAGAKRNVIASKTIREAKAAYEDEVCTHNISVTNLTEMINEN